MVWLACVRLVPNYCSENWRGLRKGIVGRQDGSPRSLCAKLFLRSRSESGYHAGDRTPIVWHFVEESLQLPLYITHGKVKNVAVVWLVGRIVLGKETGDLREKVKDLFEEGYTKIILNMDGVTLIDSAGLGALVGLYYGARSRGVSLRLCHLGSKFRDLLHMTKLYTVFDVSETQADALRIFSD